MRILAVDDEKFALASLVEAIQEAAPDAELHPFSTAEAALDFIQCTPCDAAFLDIRLRGMNGLELALQLKHRAPKVNIIFVTGYEEYAVSALRQHCSGYLLKPVRAEDVREELENLRCPVAEPRDRVYAQTFGSFALFVDGEAVLFDTARSRELLALLIDRRGAVLPNAEIAAILWEENDNITSVQAQVRKAKASLLASLRAVNADEILRVTRASIALDTAKLSCDYWQLLAGDVSALNHFAGEYMNDYSWAEITRSRLALGK